MTPRLSQRKLVALVLIVMLLAASPRVAQAAGADFQVQDLTATCCDGSATTFTVHWTGAAKGLSFEWAAQLECGTFTPSGSTAVWSHPTPKLCQTNGHQGTVAVTISDSSGSVTCVDLAGSEGTVIPGSSCLASPKGVPSGIFTTKPIIETGLNATSAWDFPDSRSHLTIDTDKVQLVSPLSGEGYVSSAITAHSFATQGSQGTLNFTLNGNAGTQGFFFIFVPNNFMTQPFTATLDGKTVNPVTGQNATGYGLNFANIHYSQHTLQITGTLPPKTTSAGSQTTQGSTSSGSTTSAGAGSGGIPELPLQLLATSAFVFLLVASYLFGRRRGISGGLVGRDLAQSRFCHA